jgi:YYY domain-containing protein
MIPFLLWYLLISVVGLIAFPIVFRLLPALADRGYGISRAFGLLVWAFGYWLLGSLGLLSNDVGSLLITLAVLIAIAVAAWQRSGPELIRDWLRQNRPVILIAELLFLLSFAAWTLVRSANPEIIATEKPMELAFVNAIIQSEAFPPNDPWLSGYAISYYYFGFVMTAMLSMVTGVSTGAGFNLSVALIFALSALGAYSLVYNLLALRMAEADSPSRADRQARFALLAPLFLVLLSNAEGFLEWLHGRGLFWQIQDGVAVSSRFWSWLAIKNLTDVPDLTSSGAPTRFWWWWRASRVVGDTNFNGGEMEVIDEFPFFSFLLADLHPHVLAIPFALLALTLALNLYLGGASDKVGRDWFQINISPLMLGVSALVMGGLAFLNTWDFPIYVAVFAGAYTLREVQREGWDWPRLFDFMTLALAVVLGGVLLYVPFYLGFSSQAGGILPNLINPTRGAHLWVMFGPLLVLLFAMLLYSARRDQLKGRLQPAIILTLVIVLGLWTLSILLASVIAALPEGQAAIGALGAPDAAALMQESLSRRLAAIGGLLTLAALVALSLNLTLRHTTEREPGATALSSGTRADLFAALLILFGTLLVLVPEFLYLRDQFGTRMNTVFKFYYQSWLLWSLAAAYGSGVLLQEWRGRIGRLFPVVVAAVLIVGLTYPYFAILTKTNRFQPADGLTLDGTLHGSYLSSDDRAAVAWLTEAPSGTLIEAVGGSYTGYARISAHSGMPALLGWPGHESQWRGGAAEMGSRQTDIEQIYRAGNWSRVSDLLAQYDVRYVYVGPLERSTYSVNENVFRANMPIAFESGQVTIYEVP